MEISMINGFHRHFNGGRGDDGKGDDDNGIQVILEVKGTRGDRNKTQTDASGLGRIMK